MFEIEFEVDRPFEEARRFVIADYFENHRRWDPGLLELDRLDDGPLREGVRGREVRRFLGRQETVFEIVEMGEGRLRLVDEPSMWRLERTYELTPTSSGCRFRFRFDMQPQAALFRVVHPVARRFIRRQVEANMAVLRGLLESLPAHDGAGNGAQPAP